MTITLKPAASFVRVMGPDFKRILKVAGIRDGNAECCWEFGRGEWIRTTDLLVPNQAL